MAFYVKSETEITPIEKPPEGELPPLVIWGPGDPRPTLPIAGWNPGTGQWPDQPPAKPPLVIWGPNDPAPQRADCGAAVGVGQPATKARRTGTAAVVAQVRLDGKHRLVCVCSTVRPGSDTIKEKITVQASLDDRAQHGAGDRCRGAGGRHPARCVDIGRAWRAAPARTTRRMCCGASDTRSRRSA